ncbi:MAG: flagellar export chaperone FlgN [Chromatiaceae bacterium]|nr:flagellar export chaperone FlgN [Chromatiaceae bacterium]MCF7993322.1 flagellar export chaperone FlgN [Chromatiaceae bacterium]MCF8002772.1 flagellar export chaperone FlgN [Chromatiaceae bacterium]MCF8014110.1 flagellar export chaperone FlgN [Chromatiaceae bacterium]
MTLAHLLGMQYDALGALVTLLEQERQALAVGNIDGELLQQIAADKQTLLEQIERAEKQRRQNQSALGYADGDAGAQEAARDANCLSDWKAVRDASERAARLNELAGAMLTMRLKHNQKMLNLIHSVAEKTLYDTRGRTEAQPGRINASA